MKNPQQPRAAKGPVRRLPGKIAESFCRSAVLFGLILTACQTEKPVEPAPSLGDITVKEINEQLQGGDYLAALQHLDFFKKNYPEKFDRQMTGLEQEARQNLSAAFKQSYNEGDYSKSLRLYQSMTALRAGDLAPQTNLTQLNNLRLEQLLAAENPVPGLIALQIRQAFKDRLTLFWQPEYTGPATRAGYLPVFRFLENQDRAGELRAAVFQKPVIDDLLKATATLWVDRGIKIERGVGVPDQSIGSGFFIDKNGYLLTNYHVIQSEVDPKYEGISQLYVRLPQPGLTKISAKVVGWDPVFDVALIKAQHDPRTIIPLEDNANLIPGAPVMAIGSPGGLEQTLTQGIVSAVRRPFLEIGEAAQVDAPINKGNSGGPLLDKEGRLAGMVFAGIESYEGINFIIPSEWLLRLTPKLYQGGQVAHSWLGASVYETKNEIEIIYVFPNSPASLAGLRYGDKLVAVNDRQIKAIEDWHRFTMSQDPDTLIRVTFIRGEQIRVGLFNLKQRPDTPLALAVERDIAEHLLPPLYGIAVRKSGRNQYRVTRVFSGMVAEQSGISVGDTFSILHWEYNSEYKAQIMQIFIKRQKVGFIEAAMLMPVSVRRRNII